MTEIKGSRPLGNMPSRLACGLLLRDTGLHLFRSSGALSFAAAYFGRQLDGDAGALG